jgi:hypothetical protein
MRVFLAVARSLGRAGKEVHAAPFDLASPALRSKYVFRVHSLPRYGDDPSKWCAAVLELLRAHSFALVVPTSDRAILPLHAHREEFAPFRIAIPSADAIPLLFEKERTRELCAELGVPVTAGARLAAGDGARQLADRFGLPLVIKASSSYALDSLDDAGEVHIVETSQSCRAS